MPALRNAIVVCLVTAGCSAGTAAPSTTTATATTVAATTTQVVVPSSTVPPTLATTSTTAPRPLVYVFPFTGKKVSYGHTHHDYPASDVFGCGANVVAPIGGVIEQTRTIDPWDPKINDPATRGGKYVAMLGDDGVRYYFAHLDSVAVQPNDVVDAGAALGIMGQTGNARNSACHTHFGISWPCPATEWAVRRGEIWPWRYLDAWRAGQQLSPVDEIASARAANPDACNLAGLATSAGDA
jgi:murein DD-endopeptidase MepM/ murein hydrolase activator NlpD